MEQARTSGRVVVVDFFATWCDSCRESLHFYDALQARYPGPLEVIAVSLDEDERTLRTFLSRERLALRIVADPSQEIAASLDVRALPTVVVFDRFGKMRDRTTSSQPDELARIEATVRRLIR